MPRPLSPRWLTSFLLVAAAATASAQTQITAGVIQGRVTDATGAVVPGSEVEARNLDTNFTRTLVTDGDGRFVFLQLAPGRYVVTVKKEGFATLVQENLILTVGQALALDPVMKVSAVAETVTVTGTTTVDASRTQASTTLNDLGQWSRPVLALIRGVRPNSPIHTISVLSSILRSSSSLMSVAHAGSRVSHRPVNVSKFLECVSHPPPPMYPRLSVTSTNGTPRSTSRRARRQPWPNRLRP